MKNKRSFEMASVNDPEELILATQRSIIKALRKIMAGAKKDLKQPGLTWEQVDYILLRFLDKKPEIIIQERPQ